MFKSGCSRKDLQKSKFTNILYAKFSRFFLLWLWLCQSLHFNYALRAHLVKALYPVDGAIEVVET